MNEPVNKRIYKVISLFIKSVILILSLYYIWDKLHSASVVMALPDSVPGKNAGYMLLIVLLMFVNWSIEALKWKFLIAPLETISFSSSLKAVFAGVTVSIFTPNRVGEFAGRIFFLEKADKIRASLMSLIGSIMQLIVTIIFGAAAYYILEKKYHSYFQTGQFISVNAVSILLIIILAAAVFIFIKNNKFSSLKKYTDTFKMYSKKELSFVFCLSLIRYAVFSIQYYFALRIFGINSGAMVLFSLIALTFFVTSAVPTFALTEIAVRTGVAIYFFGTVCSAHSSIATSSLFLWSVNLALPALIGSPFVWKIQLFKNQR